MIALEWPVLLVLLPLVVLLEAALFRRRLALAWGSALRGALAASFVSTSVGFPLAWLLTLSAELAAELPEQVLGFEAYSPLRSWLGFEPRVAWLSGLEPLWAVPASAGLLLVPSYFLAVLFEQRICVESWPEREPAAVRAAVRGTNAVSHGLLFLLAVVGVALALGPHARSAG